MKTEITLIQLTDFCNSYFTEAFNKKDYFTAGYELLYFTGCRWIEAFDLLRWNSSLTPNVFTLKTAKNNNNRTINLKLVSKSTKTLINLQKSYYTMLGYSSSKNNFRKLSSYHHLVYSNKNVLFHAFRHRIFKTLYDEGWTIPDITTYMGEKYESTTLKYVFGKLYEVI